MSNTKIQSRFRLNPTTCNQISIQLGSVYINRARESIRRNKMFSVSIFRQFSYLDLFLRSNFNFLSLLRISYTNQRKTMTKRRNQKRIQTFDNLKHRNRSICEIHSLVKHVQCYLFFCFFLPRTIASSKTLIKKK